MLEQYVQHNRVQRVYLSVRRCSVPRPGLGNPPDPANPGTLNGSQVVDTVARGNYVGMFGLGEICTASGQTPGVVYPGDPVGYCRGNLLPQQQHLGCGGYRRHEQLDRRRRAEPQPELCDLDGPLDQWLAGYHASSQGGSDKFNPSPEECWTQVLGPAGLENGTRTPDDPEAHVEDYWSMHPGGVNFLFTDGSVHFIKASINVYAWRGLATRNMGEIISPDSY